MPTIRTKKNKGSKIPFTRILSASLQDERLSWKARGLLAYMLSKPDNFKFHLDELTKHAPDGLDGVKAGVKELELLGYVKRYPVKVKGKIVYWQMDIYELPQVDLPQVEKPLEENPMLITNDLITKEKEITIDKNYYIEMDFDGNVYLTLYNNYFKKHFGKDHMAVSEDQLETIVSNIELLELNDITLGAFGEVVEEHFDNLPAKNNGNILAFIPAFPRHFDLLALGQDYTWRRNLSKEIQEKMERSAARNNPQWPK